MINRMKQAKLLARKAELEATIQMGLDAGVDKETLRNSHVNREIGEINAELGMMAMMGAF